jgi:hypothetical protein
VTSSLLINNFLNKLPENQLLITEELRAIIKSLLTHSKEKLAYGVPFYYLNKRVAFIWPTAIPRSGVKEDGVLLGFTYGYKMQNNVEKFRGKSNKVVRFVVYNSLKEINMEEIANWLDEVVEIDLKV